MATKTIDLTLNLETKGMDKGSSKAVSNLKAIQDQANKTREAMAKMTEVGTKMAMVGGAILAPLTLAMNKYVSTMKETEPASRRITELSKKWEESQVRLGRIVATTVLPALEKAATILEKVISFSEKNPDVIKAALVIGSVLVGAGALVAFIAQVVGFIATVQGLAAGFGLATAGAGAGAAVGGVGLAAAVAAGITLALPVVIAALILSVVGPLTLGFFNALMGTNQTWADLLDTAKKLPAVINWAANNLGQWLGKALSNGLNSMGKWISDGLKSVWSFITGKASGGYVGKGLYSVGERGREFVLNASSTRNAERAIGGRLSQQSASMMMTNNYQVGNGATIAQTRRMIRANEGAILGTLAGAFA